MTRSQVQQADSYYAPRNARLYEVMGHYSEAELDLVEKIIDELSAVVGGLVDDPALHETAD